jgi:Uma2 family endonuclease
MAELTQIRMRAEEFLALPETNLPTELIDGAVIMSPTPKDLHQGISLRLLQVLLQHIAGGTLRYAPADVHLDDLNVVQPDLFWVSGPESRCTLGKDGYWHGAPDLVIEILSPGTARRDRREKFSLYEQHGVREYWLVDPDAQYVEVWGRVGEGFERLGVFGPEESFESAVLGGKRLELKGVFGA